MVERILQRRLWQLLSSPVSSELKPQVWSLQMTMRLEVVDNLEREEMKMKDTFARERNRAGNLNLIEKLICSSFSS